MDIQFEKQDTLTASLKLTINEADYQKDFDKKLRTYAQKVNMKGFRPGKVPPGLVRKMYGDQLLAEHIQDVLQSETSKYFHENELDLILSPIPLDEKVINWRTQKDFEFSFKIAEKPDFEIKFSDFELTQYEVEVDETEIDEIVDDILEQNVKFESTEEKISQELLGAKSAIKLTYEMKSMVADEETGEEKEEVSEETIDLKGEEIASDYHSLFVGKGQNDTITIENPKSFFENDKQVAYPVAEDLKNQEEPQEFKISEVSEGQEAELGEEVFKQSFPDEEIQNAEEFRAKIKEALQKNYEAAAGNLLKQELTDKVFEETVIDLPEEYLKEWLTYQHKAEGKPEEELNIEESTEGLKKDLTRELIFLQGQKDSEAKVEHEELRAFLRAQIGQQFGMANMPMNEQMAELLDNVVDNILKDQNQDMSRQAYQEVLFRKVLDYWVSKVEPTIKSIGKDEFKELLKEQENKNAAQIAEEVAETQEEEGSGEVVVPDEVSGEQESEKEA